MAAALVPTFATGLIFYWSADLIAIVALLGSGPVLPGAGRHGRRHQLRRHRLSSREMMIASLAEPAMLLVVFTLALIAGTTQLSAIADFMLRPASACASRWAWRWWPWSWWRIAENARIPIDNPATHLELTMVHEAMVLEYSGRHLALIEIAAALKLVLYFSLLACMFLPFGMATAAAPASAPCGRRCGLSGQARRWRACCWLVFETAIAKMRVFRVGEFLGGALMLGLLGVFLLFVSRGF